ncbi:hypothetical protein BJ508DRAFT_419912 [Ascobolus immersus RN42]|uniref:Uncharacterized protein n=1 Tax=Ascobolus immersus RN42 TaxID=1160509 RepID=A0A3N4HEX0_ASCIM|nr:hypothetical protein BJ508DRAFT_419912 [Ascobolus immersus RN42]
MQFKLLPVLALVFGFAQTISAVAIPSNDIVSADVLSARSVATSSVEDAFAFVESIPDSVLENGDFALNFYLIGTGVKSPSGAVEGLQGDAGSCALEIAKFIALNVVQVAKILRIKKYIAALGGAKQAAQLLLRATTASERLRIGGQALKDLFAEISGVNSLVKACT